MDSAGNKRLQNEGSTSKLKSLVGDSPGATAVAIAERSPMTRLANRIAAVVATELLNEKETSRILKTPTGTLRRWRCTGEGPIFIKLGSGPKAAVRYDPLDIASYIEDGRRHPIRAGATKGNDGDNKAR